MNFFIRLATCGILLCSCSSKESKPLRYDVLVSIPPYLYFVEQLTSGQLSAISIIPPGVNPHLYEPTPKDVENIYQAKVWIRLTETFESKIAKALQHRTPDLVTVNLIQETHLPTLPEDLCEHSHSCESCSHENEGQDLHIWMSLRLAKQQAQAIAKGLIQAFPKMQPLIEVNLKKLLSNFDSTDQSLSFLLTPYKSEAILVSHPAFGYFCHDYDLVELSIETEGKDPLPNRITELLECAHNTPIRITFTQAQYSNKGAEMIADKLHIPIHEVDPYSQDYLANIEHIAHLIADPK